MIDLQTTLLVISVSLGGINLGFVLKMIYNELEHIKGELKELRELIVDHLRWHSSK